MTKNIDVSDGLVNGVFGTVSHIQQATGVIFPQIIYVVFDHSKVGEKLRKEKHIPSTLPKNSTPIFLEEDRVTNSGGIRRQFPLKLAFACTIHKIQGCTLKRAVVSLDKIFTAGQAYVALSRVTSLEGLIIQHFKESAIYCNENVEIAMASMPHFITSAASQNLQYEIGGCKILLHNIEGLKSHIKDLRLDGRFSEGNFICLTETWLSSDDSQGNLEIIGFAFQHKTRQQSYDTSKEVYNQLQQQSHGGVGLYNKINNQCNILNLPVTNLEYLAFYSGDWDITVAVIYRPPSYKPETFCQNLMSLLTLLDKYPGGCIVMGDFNEDILKVCSLQKIMENQGFRQYVEEPTTENGTLIDHVYVKRIAKVNVNMLPTYYSYHEAILIQL